MKSNINLLPLRVKLEHRRRRIYMRCAAVQLLIILLLATAIYAVNHMAYQAWNESDKLAVSLLEFAPESLQAAVALQTAQIRYTARAEFLEFYERDDFCPSWFYALTNLPHGVAPAGLNFNGQYILVTAETADLRLIEAHRQLVLEFFPHAQIGRINRNDDAFFTYELRLEIRHDEN